MIGLGLFRIGLATGASAGAGLWGVLAEFFLFFLLISRQHRINLGLRGLHEFAHLGGSLFARCVLIGVQCLHFFSLRLLDGFNFRFLLGCQIKLIESGNAASRAATNTAIAKLWTTRGLIFSGSVLFWSVFLRIILCVDCRDGQKRAKRNEGQCLFHIFCFRACLYYQGLFVLLFISGLAFDDPSSSQDVRNG